MHPALHSWRDDIPATLVRMIAYLGGLALLSILAAQIFQTKTVLDALTPTPRSAWVDVGRPYPAFALSIPEAVGVSSHYVIRRNVEGGGRKDILSLGDPDGADPWLRVEIYRAGSEIDHFAPPQTEIAEAAAALGPAAMTAQPPLGSKFGPLSVVGFATTKGAPRQCLGFVRSYDDPKLQISGWFCRGGEAIDRSTLACALDRLTLLFAGNEPKITKLFADAELHRKFCGQHDPILAPTPKYQLLWKALPNRPPERRVGR